MVLDVFLGRFGGRLAALHHAAAGALDGVATTMQHGIDLFTQVRALLAGQAAGAAHQLVHLGDQVLQFGHGLVLDSLLGASGAGFQSHVGLLDEDGYLGMESPASLKVARHGLRRGLP